MKTRIGIVLLVLGVLFSVAYGVMRLGAASAVSVDPSQRAAVHVGDGPPDWVAWCAGVLTVMGAVVLLSVGLQRPADGADEN